ncbi:MAG: cob(I)yrinic acid a,c-diamide adenosyltransferase [Acetivibrio sp.]
MIQIYHGNGKGKTTAAIGLTIRGVGNGMRVIFAQFLKGGETGELRILNQLDQVQVLRNTKDLGFTFQMSDEDKEEVKKMHNETLKKVAECIENKKVDLVVLDEVTYPYQDNLMDKKILEELILNLPKEVELVMTGREPAAFLLKNADYITNMKCERHPFEQNIMARKGIEY